MDHSTYSWRHGIWRSWFSKAFYRDVGLNWHGSGFGYLFFLLFICTIVLCIFVNIHLHRAVTNIQANYIPQVPVVSFTKGKMTLADNQVHVIKDTEGNPLVVFDPTNQYSQKHMPSAPVLFKSEGVYITEQSGAVTEHVYPTSVDVTVTSDTANTFAENFKRWGIVLLGLSLLISAYIYRILASLVYSLIGNFIIAKCFRPRLSYSSILRIVVVAQTPVIILSTLGAMFNLYIAHAWIAGVVLNLLYITYGIRAASVAPPATTVTSPVEQPAP